MSFKGVEKYWWTLQHGKDFSSKDNIGWFQQLLWFQIFSCLQGLPWAGVPSGWAECRRCVKHTALLYYLSNGSCWHSDPCSISGLIQTHVEGSSNFIPFHWVSHFLWLHTEVEAPVCLVAQLSEGVPCCVGSHCCVSKETVTRSIQEELKAVQEGWLSRASGSEKAWDEQGKNRNFSWLNDWFNVCLGRICQESSEL